MAQATGVPTPLCRKITGSSAKSSSNPTRSSPARLSLELSGRESLSHAPFRTPELPRSGAPRSGAGIQGDSI
jgi:hypothetical protein